MKIKTPYIYNNVIHLYIYIYVNQSIFIKFSTEFILNYFNTFIFIVIHKGLAYLRINKGKISSISDSAPPLLSSPFDLQIECQLSWIRLSGTPIKAMV